MGRPTFIGGLLFILGDFLLVPSALGIRPLAFALAVSVEPSFVPDFIFFFKTARDGASSV